MENLKQLVDKFKDMCEYKFGETKTYRPAKHAEYDPEFEVTETEKYYKIVHFHRAINYPSVFCKIDKQTGDIYKNTCRKPSANIYKEGAWKCIGQTSVYAPQLAQAHGVKHF